MMCSEDYILVHFINSPTDARVLLGEEKDDALGFVATVYLNETVPQWRDSCFIVRRRQAYLLRVRNSHFKPVELNFWTGLNLPPYGHITIDIGKLMFVDP